MAVFHSMAHRLVSIPLNSVRYEIETEKILEIGRINGYPSTTIKHIIRKHEIKKEHLEVSILFNEVKEETNRVVIPYAQASTNELAYMYRKYGQQAVNNNIYSLQKLIGGTKDKIPDLLKSGIYELECEPPCDFIYNGMSERNPTVRYGEHEQSFNKKDTKSAVARHLIQNNHKTDISRLKLVRPVSGRNTTAFECWEKIHIVKNRRTKNLMNLNDGNINSILFNLI